MTSWFSCSSSPPFAPQNLSLCLSCPFGIISACEALRLDAEIACIIFPNISEIHKLIPPNLDRFKYRLTIRLYTSIPDSVSRNIRGLKILGSHLCYPKNGAWELHLAAGLRYSKFPVKSWSQLIWLARYFPRSAGNLVSIFFWEFK